MLVYTVIAALGAALLIFGVVIAGFATTRRGEEVGARFVIAGALILLTLTLSFS
jgi:hypothetical protein